MRLSEAVVCLHSAPFLFTYLQGKLTEDGHRSSKRDRGRSQLVRRHARLQRTCVDPAITRRTDIRGSAASAAADTSGRFTSFLVADILGIVSRDPEPVTSSDEQQRRQRTSKSSEDFSVMRLIHSDHDARTTSTTSMSAHSLSST